MVSRHRVILSLSKDGRERIGAMRVGAHGLVDFLSRHGVGQTVARRSCTLRTTHARRRASRPELGNDLTQTRPLPVAFDGFDPARVARYGARKRAALLADAGIVRNRLKIDATIGNAAAFLAVQEAFGSFDAYWWAFVDGKPIVNRPHTMADVPAQTPLAAHISADLKRRGFRFVGPTIVYSFMQASGLVNDHLAGCALG